MSEKTESKHELLKQNMELTLIITFIGLAFGLVGLIVQTAEVMSVVVIAVGVIVGFVSYHDAFAPRPLPQEAVSRQVAPTLPTPPPVAKPEPLVRQVPPATPTSIKSEAARESAGGREPLPNLPKVQRLPSSQEVAKPFAPIARPASPKIVAKEQATAPPQRSSTSPQATNARPSKPRPKKAIEVSQVNEKKQG